MKGLLKRLLGLGAGAADGKTAARPTELAGPRDHAATLAALLRAHPRGGPHEVFRGVSDDFWYWALTEGRRANATLRELLPGLPADELQVQFTGHSGDEALNEAFWIYQAFKSLFEMFNGPVARCESVLDFGCGWGRLTRFFLKDLEASRLWGVDPAAEVIAACEQTYRGCRFRQIPFRPPYPLPEAAFDWVFSYSVFSHLSEAMHQEVLGELHRVLKPGGLLIATTYPRAIIAFCHELRENEQLRKECPESVVISAASFPDTERALADYDAGRYCHSSLNFDGDWSHWGDTAIPEAYVREHWARRFEFVTFLSDPDSCPQNVIVVRK